MAIFRGNAQEIELEEALRPILDEALQLNIIARVLPLGTEQEWNMRSSKLTIPGRSIAVKLLGENIRIFVVLTPYWQENGKLLLVAQGEVLISEMAESEVKYLSTVKSIPISLGEKVLFFPLGVSRELRKSFNIELEIEILSYKDLLEKSAD
ncbi:MAG TPA: hypothetical protein ENI06_11565 [Spirochaetales bacterium]|nr:hypothetical protein [Spirochaetales bacterium]